MLTIILPGESRPAKDDIEITSQLKAAGETLDIRLLDHIIFNQKDSCSILENVLSDRMPANEQIGGKYGVAVFGKDVIGKTP